MTVFQGFFYSVILLQLIILFEVGIELVNHPKIKAVGFTGSIKAGSEITPEERLSRI